MYDLSHNLTAERGVISTAARLINSTVGGSNMTAVGLPMPRVDAQPYNRIATMRANFIRRRDENAAKAARAEFVVQRTDALGWVDHYNRLIAMTEGRA